MIEVKVGDFIAIRNHTFRDNPPVAYPLLVETISESFMTVRSLRLKLDGTPLDHDQMDVRRIKRDRVMAVFDNEEGARRVCKRAHDKWVEQTAMIAALEAGRERCLLKSYSGIE